MSGEDLAETLAAGRAYFGAALAGQPAVRGALGAVIVMHALGLDRLDGRPDASSIDINAGLKPAAYPVKNHEPFAPIFGPFA